MRRWLSKCLVFTGLAIATVSSSAIAADAATDKLDFGRDVRAILSNNCFKCHGPDEKQRQAGLRLDTRDGAIAKLESGKTGIVTGKWSDSEIIARLTTDNADLKMPPPSSGKKVSPEQIETLKRWINEGAEYKPHWAFVAAARPELPKVTDESWIKNPIDRFVLAKLDKAGLKPSPQADKVTLIRRLTFDLTGLPPTPAEVDAFVADNSAEAYDKLVERLFNSARHGEHQGRYWLDAARYGDTHGLHLDNERSLWPYRDWVIGAFNRNVLFDQFTVEQLAGDLLPNATMEQRIASGFNRCNVTTSEGGSIDDEVRVRYAVDRTEAIGTVWLGLTVGCAVCHDHKFDPISQKEFYQLYAFYGSTADAAMDGNALLPPPNIKLPSAEHTAQFKAIDDELAAVRKQISDEVAKIEYTEPAPVEGKPAGEPKEFVWIDDTAPSGAQLQGNSPWEFVSKPAPVFSGEKATKRTGAGITQHFFTGATAPLKIGEGDKFFAYCYLDPANPPKTVMLQWNDGQWEHRAFWGEDKISFGAGDVPGHRRLGDLPKLGEWVRLEVDAAHVGLPAGKLVNGWAFTQFDGTMFWDKSGLVTRTPQDGGGFESLLAWEAYDKAQAQSTVPQPIRDAIKLEADKRNDDQKKQIREYFLANVYAKSRPTLDPLNAKIATLNKQRTDIDGAIPSTMVMADMPQLRETNILIRGAYNKKGDKVTHGVPAALGGKLPEGAPVNRLGLAKWLVDPSHPLSSRVTVNRFWQQFFGRGIVKTSEDFGVQGDWPTHPELLDWLAAKFVEEGWSLKKLHRRIMLSATYQQSGTVSREQLDHDPENRWLGRFAARRLDAEAIRDALLFVAGQLDPTPGGPAGDDLTIARRTLYVQTARWDRGGYAMLFDAANPDASTEKRVVSTVAPQALLMLNNEYILTQARHLAERLLKDVPNDDTARIHRGYQLLFGRDPSVEELEISRQIVGRTGDSIGWTDLAHVLLCSNEFVYLD